MLVDLSRMFSFLKRFSFLAIATSEINVTSHHTKFSLKHVKYVRYNKISPVISGAIGFFSIYFTNRLGRRIERVSIECRITKTKPFTYQLDYSVDLKPQ